MLPGNETKQNKTKRNHGYSLCLKHQMAAVMSTMSKVRVSEYSEALESLLAYTSEEKDEA